MRLLSGGSRATPVESGIRRPASSRSSNPQTLKSRSRRVQHLLDGYDQAVELLAFVDELFAPRGSQRVKACAAVVFGCTPLAFHPPFEQQALQRRVERALANLQDFVRDLTQALRNAVAMHRTGGECFENQQLQRAREQVRRLVRLSHRLSMGRAYDKGGSAVNPAQGTLPRSTEHSAAKPP